MNRLKDIIFAAVRPHFWFRNYPASGEWDQLLNDLLRSYPVIRESKYEVEIGGVKVWVENYPFAYGYPREAPCKVLPFRRTVGLLYRMTPPERDSLHDWIQGQKQRAMVAPEDK